MLYVFNNIKKKDILDAIINMDNNKDLLISKLIDFAIEYSICGNIYKKFILYTFIFNDNAYTRAIERNKSDIGYVSYIDKDLRFFYDLYQKELDSGYNEIIDFKIQKDKNNYISKLVDELYNNIDNTFDSFKNNILSFYKEKGLGDMALYKAFRVSNGIIKPIKNVLDFSFDDLIGYDMQKKLLCENTEYFLYNRPYNNVLLYGDSGTGKSSSIKALTNKYFNEGLRIIEVYKHQMEEISKIIHKLKSRPYHYIIYMDDLSFEEDEAEYKYLKSIIEGGIEPKPSNVCVYATSNRRHLIKETVKDNFTIDDDLNRNETQAEKLSLAYRFGLQIFYSSLTPNEFREMVIKLAKNNNINMPIDDLMIEANRWQLKYGSLSGRCAQQFISYLTSKVVK